MAFRWLGKLISKPTIGIRYLGLDWKSNLEVANMFGEAVGLSSLPLVAHNSNHRQLWIWKVYGPHTLSKSNLLSKANDW